MESVPKTYSRDVTLVEPHQVAEKIKNAKKPLSALEGDLLPALQNTCADISAIPATRIFNICNMTNRWPIKWKRETQSALPKTSNPCSYDQLRNISCTSFLSKIMESFLLDNLRAEVKMKDNQYGGQKGTGMCHFLIDTHQKILECLEDGASAVTLMSVDFSKAFNRMCHYACLDELALRGASNESLRMTTAFLIGRTMQFKVGNTLSTERNIRGGLTARNETRQLPIYSNDRGNRGTERIVGEKSPKVDSRQETGG